MKREERLLPLNDHEWIHLVVDRGEPGEGIVIICHGLTGDRTGPMQLLANLANFLAENGLTCVRFDFRGSGDSSGAFEDTTFTRMLEDVHVISRWTREQFPNHAGIGYCGLSIGGVAASFGAVHHQGSALALISSDIIENIRIPVAGLVSIRDGQFFLHEEFYRQREKLKPRSELRQSGIPTKLFYGELDLKLAAAAEELSAMGMMVESFSGTDHLFEQFTVRKKLYRSVLDFFKQYLRGAQ